MKTVLVATSSEILSDAIKQALEDVWRVHVCVDGNTALDTLRYLQPEGLVLSLDMPGKDGFEILTECFPNIPSATLVLSSFINEYVSQSCAAFGVKYLIRLPCEIPTITNRLNDIWNSLEHMPTAAALHLRLLGFNEALDGFNFLCVAIPNMAEDVHRQLHKEIYTVVVDRCDATSVGAVERSIRECIQKAWKNRNEATWAQYFELGNNGHVPCPSNKRFICTIAKRL